MNFFSHDEFFYYLQDIFFHTFILTNSSFIFYIFFSFPWFFFKLSSDISTVFFLCIDTCTPPLQRLNYMLFTHFFNCYVNKSNYIVSRTQYWVGHRLGPDAPAHFPALRRCIQVPEKKLQLWEKTDKSSYNYQIGPMGLEVFFKSTKFGQWPNLLRRLWLPNLMHSNFPESTLKHNHAYILLKLKLEDSLWKGCTCLLMLFFLLLLRWACVEGCWM